MDSDLADAVSTLQGILERRNLDGRFGKAPAELVDQLKKSLRVPARFRAFLLEANPVRVETETPIERVRLIPAEELIEAQKLVCNEDGEKGDWKSSWVLIAESTLLGDPYFLELSKLDAEGDCPVYTAMSGQDRWVPTLAASSFAQFLRILAVGMETAVGFGDAIMDDEDEDAFREALGPKIKVIDAAAMRAGHWT